MDGIIKDNAVLTLSINESVLVIKKFIELIVDYFKENSENIGHFTIK